MTLKNSKNLAFSLVEMAMILAIVGLLVGGVVTGKSLIRGSELRKVSADYARYMTATNAFRTQYGQLPGDMNNATQYWGTDPDGCPENVVRTYKTTTCNGDGNGNIDQPAAGVESLEGIRFWQHLAFAGLIEGQYIGQRTNSRVLDIGINVPKSSIRSAGWYALSIDPWPVESGSVQFVSMYGNTFEFGTVRAGSRMVDPAITSEEAWNIDTKLDDGVPRSGNLMTWKSGLDPGCTTTNNSTTSQYDLTSTDIACSLIFIWPKS